MDNQTLVSVLKNQHTGLKNDLVSVSEKTEGEAIASGLSKFKIDLVAHLTLEDNSFYTELIKRMRDKGQDTKNTEAFMESMKDIAKVVTAFLEKYSDPIFISNNISNFKLELGDIIRTLLIRIESEEEGVYEVFLMI